MTNGIDDEFENECIITNIIDGFFLNPDLINDDELENIIIDELL